MAFSWPIYGRFCMLPYLFPFVASRVFFVPLRVPFCNPVCSLFYPCVLPLVPSRVPYCTLACFFCTLACAFCTLACSFCTLACSFCTLACSFCTLPCAFLCPVQYSGVFFFCSLWCSFLSPCIITCFFFKPNIFPFVTLRLPFCTLWCFRSLELPFRTIWRVKVHARLRQFTCSIAKFDKRFPSRIL